jgi:hypothetical protein
MVEQLAGKDVTTMTVVWPEQRFSPVEYHSFGVGPFSVVVTVRPGETPDQAFDRAWNFLAAQARKMYPSALADFLCKVREAAGAAKATKARG